MLKCRDVVANAENYLDGAQSWHQRLAMRFHLLICDKCRRYVRQLRALLRATPFMHGKASDDEVSRVMDHIHSHDHSHR